MDSRTKTGPTPGVGETRSQEHEQASQASCGWDDESSNNVSTRRDACGLCHSTSASGGPMDIRLLHVLVHTAVAPHNDLDRSEMGHDADLGRSAVAEDAHPACRAMACPGVLDPLGSGLA